MNKDYKSGFVTLIGSSERGEIYVDELFDRTEDCNYIQ